MNKFLCVVIVNGQVFSAFLDERRVFNLVEHGHTVIRKGTDQKAVIVDNSILWSDLPEYNFQD